MGRFLVTLALVGAASAGCGEPSLVAELEVVATRYHENLARLDGLRKALERAVDWGQTEGLLRSLCLRPIVLEKIRTILELDPTMFTAVYALAGNVSYEVPGIFGGDYDRAESMFRKGLDQDPRLTGMRVGLGKTLIKKRRLAEARRELLTVLMEQAPTSPADWRRKDEPEARTLLDSLRGTS